MQNLGLVVIATALGAASVSLFVCSLMSLLASVAAVVLYIRGLISMRSLLSRITGKLSAMLFYSLLLLLLYTIYLKLLGWGKNRSEQMAYIIGCIPVMLIFLKNIKANMIHMFDPEADD